MAGGQADHGDPRPRVRVHPVHDLAAVRQPRPHQPELLEAGRDLGASPYETFRRVTLPLSKPAILAGLVIVSLPMFGDYYTNNLLGSATTSMFGNLIDNAVGSSGQGPEAGSLVLILIVIVMVPMLYYLRATRRAAEGIA